MKLETIVKRLDDELAIAAYAEVDGSPNGLQVGHGAQEIESVVLAVDAVAQTIAAAADADLLVTHHGLWWEGTARLTGQTYDRVAALIEAGLALYVAHLPLDGHQAFGNAAGLADHLNVVEREPFGSIEDQYIGQRGQLPEPRTCTDIASELETALSVGNGSVQSVAFGPDRVRDVAIVTGSGVDWLAEAAETDADLLITGEGKHRVYHEARELEMNVILAGHYATETGGVQAVGELLTTWGLDCRFVDVPTGL